MNVQDWIKGKDYPSWGDDQYLLTLINGYLSKNENNQLETPLQGYRRISRAAAKTVQGKKIAKKLNVNLEEKFFELFWKCWLIPASPVMANTGTNRGLSASCYGGNIEDDMNDIIDKLSTVKKMITLGGGVGMYLNVRPGGEDIANGSKGKTNSALNYLLDLNQVPMIFQQSGMRRGAVAVYMNVHHPEISKFINISHERSNENYCRNLQTGVMVDDIFMKKMLLGYEKETTVWQEMLEMRALRGYPYICFTDNFKKGIDKHWNLPLDTTIRASNLCTEIGLPTNKDNSFVCFLSSMNLALFDEWKDTDAVFYATIFLDCIVEIFESQIKDIPFMHTTANFVKNTRALGLGALGFHTYLQLKNYPYDGMLVKSHYVPLLFGHIKNEAERASEFLGELLGTPMWVKKSSKRRNLTLTAIAPNRSSAILGGSKSEGIQPYVSNYTVNQSAKVTFTQIPEALVTYLKDKNMYTKEVLDSIEANQGSVAHLDIPQEDKDVFKTRLEINQYVLIDIVGEIQKYIDQGISLNLTFHADVDPEFVNICHIYAWKRGLKSLYYYFTTSALNQDYIETKLTEIKSKTTPSNNNLHSIVGCVACEG